MPLGAGELQLYRAIREAVPILDAAIWKLIRLAGGVAVKCGSPPPRRGWSGSFRTVPHRAGTAGHPVLSGLLSGLHAHLRAGGGRTGAGLPGPGDRRSAVRRTGAGGDPGGDSPLDFQLCARGPGGTCEPLPWQELLLFTPFQPETEHPYGVSLLRSMPFLTDILLKIYQATGMNWERMGNVRFAVICRPGEGEGAYAQERCRQIAGEWSAAMQAGKQGPCGTLWRWGIWTSRSSGRTIRCWTARCRCVRSWNSSLPAPVSLPFLLGLSWSSTERMSAQQADLMTSEITALRRTLEPAVERICEMWLRLHGWGGDVTVDWADINLQDFVEEARAKLYLAQAEAIREEERT